MVTSIYVIDGYQLKREDLDHGPYLVRNNDELGFPADTARTLAEQVDDPVWWVNYPAGGNSFLGLMSAGINPIQWIKHGWNYVTSLSSTLKNVDRFAESLAQEIQNCQEPPIIIGQSMGARLALKTREFTSAKVIAFCPPLSHTNLNWDRFTDSTEPAECFFTREDGQLQGFVFLRQADYGSVLGLHGVPAMYRGILRPIDLTPASHCGDDPLTTILRRHSSIMEGHWNSSSEVNAA